MPDEPTPPPAPAAAEPTDTTPESGDTPSTPDSQSTATTTTTTPAEEKELTFDEAQAILDAADQKSARKKTTDPLADPEDLDPLEDPDATDPLETDDLDEVLPDETEEPAAEETPEVEAATPEGEPEATPSTEPETDPDGLPKRIRIKLDELDPRDAAILLHARKTKKTFEEAKAELFGTTEAPAKAKETEVKETTPEETPETIITEIDALKAQRREAGLAFDTKALVEIDDKLDAAKERLTEARARKTAKETAVQTQYESGLQESMGRAEEAYPDAFKPGTDLHDAINADKQRLEKQNPAFFDDPEWPETLVYKHAGKLGKVKATAQTTTAPAAKPAAKAVVKQPLKPARPVPGPAPGGRSATESKTSETVIRERLKAAEAKGDTVEVDRIIKELETAA